MLNSYSKLRKKVTKIRLKKMKNFYLILCMIFSIVIVSIPIISTYLFTDMFNTKNETIVEEPEPVTQAKRPTGSELGIAKCVELSDNCLSADFTPTLPTTTTNQWLTTEWSSLAPGIGIYFKRD